MDNLAMNAMLAKEAGMSYGQWKALQPVVKLEKTIPEGWEPCEYCGKLFKKSKGKRFCEIGCRTAAYRQKANAQCADYYRRVRKARRKEKQDGKAENVRGE